MSRRSSTRNIKLIIRYDGTRYSGWQFQKNAETVQATIESALKRITGRKSRLAGASRTDSGVHAVHQVANFKTHSKLPLSKIKDALNSCLPEDILIVSAESVPLKFDSQLSAKSKRYRYTVTTERFADPFIRDFASRFSYPLKISSMRRAAKTLTGRHDFKAFQASDSAVRLRPYKSAGSKSRLRGVPIGFGGRQVYNNLNLPMVRPCSPSTLSEVEGPKSTVRTIKRIKIERRGDLVYIDVWANGFLYNMVRIIVGTLLEIGRGKMPEDSIREMLLKRDRRLAGPTAPAKGLCLMNVEY